MNISCNCHFRNTSKEWFWPKKISNFMHGFKSAILAIFQFCKMALLILCMKFKKFFGQNRSFEALRKWQQEKNIHNLSQGPPNPGLMQEKVLKGDFLKKDSRELKFFSCFRFLWISRRPGMLNWERVVFLPSKILYRKCEQDLNPRSSSLKLSAKPTELSSLVKD